MSDPDPPLEGDPPLEFKLVVGLAGLGAVLLLLSGLALLGRGDTTGLLLGGSTVAVAFGQGVVFVALYRLRSWAWNAALALLVAGAMLQLGTGDFFGALVSVFIAGYVYTQRDLVVG